MTSPKVYLCSSGTEDQRHSLGVLRDSALSFGGVDGVFLYVTDKETTTAPTTVVDDAMKRLRGPDDVLVYCDANTIIKGSTRAVASESFEKLEGATFAIYKKRAWTGERTVAGGDDPLPDFMEYHGKNLGPTVQTAVITATTGSPSLTRCLASVQAQTLGGVTHVVVVDGEEHRDAVERQVDAFRWKKPVEVVVLPRNTGAGGWNGHRIYGAMPFLTDAHYVAFLDEDNWFLPEHLMGLMKHARASGYPWTFSLRAVYDSKGRFVANDSCESLGNMAHTVLGPTDFLVDTSCMLLETRVAVEAGSAWYQRERGHDRAYTAHLLQKYPRISGVPRHTVCYTAGSTGNSVAPDFFSRGNAVTGYDFETKKTLYVFHFNPEATRALFETRHRLDRSYALDEWQPTLLRDLARTWNLVDGYAVEPVIPPGATVYVSMCLPHQMPLETLRRRAGEIFRVGYTVESPNIRHREQWADVFLRAHFDRVLTYWTPLLLRRDPTFAVFCPHNTHHLDFSNPRDLEVLVDPSKSSWVVKKNACMVLERRPELFGKYSIDSQVLECLDPLREHYVRDLSDVTVYGVGWADVPNVKIGHALHRSNDPRKTVDIIKNYDFTIIIENTDADGYVSEKIYDAFIACSIPIYYGNNNDATVGIPRDMYVDLKNFATSRDLDAYIRSLTIEDVRAMKRRIVEGRRAVLERVSTRAFADAFNALFASS